MPLWPLRRPSLLCAAAGLVFMLICWVPWPVGQVWLTSASALLFFLFFVSEPQPPWRQIRDAVIQRRREFIYLGCWVSVIIVNWLLGRGPAAFLHLEITIAGALFYVMALCLIARQDGSYELLIQLTFGILALNALVALPVILAHPTAVRMAMLGAETGDVSLVRAGQYQQYVGGAIVYPVFLALVLSCRGWKRGLAGLALLIITTTFLLSTLSMVLLLLSVGTALYLFLRLALARISLQQKVRQLVLVVTILVILVGLAGLTLGQMPQFLFAVEKLQSITSGISGGGLEQGDPTGRGKLDALSVRTILQYPLFGVGPTSLVRSPKLYRDVGGHSSWLDHPAEYGLLGFLPYLLFLFAALENILRSWRRDTEHSPDPARLVSVVLFLLAGLLDPVVMILYIWVLFAFLVLGGPLGNSAASSPPVRRYSA